MSKNEIIFEGVEAEPLTEAEQAALAADPVFVAKVEQSLAELNNSEPVSFDDTIAWLRSI